MAHLKRLVLISLLATVAVIIGWPELSRAVTTPCAKGDPVVCGDTDTVDMGILRINGQLVGTAVGNPIVSVRANQALAAGTVIQHAGLTTQIEIVQISSTGGAITSTATPRILSGVNGQIIILQGTSATNTYTIPTASGVLWGASSILFDNLTSRILTYNSSISAWVEGVTTTGGGGGITEWSADITPAQITAAQNNYAPTGLATATVLRLSSNASQDITGLTGGSDGRILILRNVGAQNIVLQPESGSSTAANRFAIPAAITMLPTAMVVLQYDVTSLRWYAIFSSAAAAGGGSDVEKLPVAAATTGNIANLANPGTAVFDGLTLVNGQRLLIWQQTTATQNGIYIFNGSGSALTRATDADADAEFASNFQVFNHAASGLYAQRTFRLSNTGSITLGSTNIAFAIAAYGPGTELLANKSTVATSVANGYVGADANGRVAYNRLGSYAAAAPLANATTLTPTALTMGVESSVTNGGTSTAVPRIADGVDGQLLILEGTSAANTWTIPNGSGVRLCGNTGSVVVGLNAEKPIFKYSLSQDLWNRLDCPTMQSVANAGRTIVADETNPVKICNAAGTSCKSSYVDSATGSPTDSATCSGVACPNTTVNNPLFTNSGSKPTCAVGIRGARWDVLGGTSVADIHEVCDKDSADVYAWRAAAGGGVTDRSVRITNSAAQTIEGADEVITFDDETCTGCYDTDNMHSTSSNTGRITFTNAGKYLVMCHGRIAAGSLAAGATLVDGYLRLNGTTILPGAQRFGAQAPAIYLNPGTIYNFASSDYVEFLVTHDASGSLSFERSATRYPFCEASKIN